MGCSGSTNQPKKPHGSIKRKKTQIKKGGAGQVRTNMGAKQSSAPGTKASNGEEKKVVKEQRMEANGSSHAVSSTPNQGAAGIVKKPTAPIVVSNNYNQENIEDIVKDFENKNDKIVSGENPKSVTLFGKDFYDTTDWTPVLFAIHNKNLRAVRYFIEHKRYHRRLSTRKREIGADETHYDAEAFALLIAMSNKDEAMLDYLWGMNELWDYEHLKIVLEAIFTKNLWADGMKILLGSEATQDIYNALSFHEKKKFMLQLFYRYLYYAPENVKDFIKDVSVNSPYSLIAVHYLMTEDDPKNIDLIEKACQEITLEDYVKMKYEADANFLEEWNKGIANYSNFPKEFQAGIEIVNK